MSTSQHTNAPAVCGVRSVHFGVADFVKTRGFFVDGWGLREAEAGADGIYLRAAGADAYVVALRPHVRAEVLRVDLRAPSLEALAALRARLADAGVAELGDISALDEFGGGYGFGLRDPDGRLLKIVADDARRAPEPSPDRPTKISHLVMNVADPRSLEAFYIDLLGFRLVDRTKRITFLNCNSDHHSLALVPGSRTALHHIAFELPSFDGLMRGVGRLREYGTKIGWGVGRHGPGNNIFAYFVGPENIPLEYTAEVQQVDQSYRVGSPDDWKPIPGRMDLWGATPPPTVEMAKAEASVEFAR